jgi:hypothetical protein
MIELNSLSLRLGLKYDLGDSWTHFFYKCDDDMEIFDSNESRLFLYQNCLEGSLETDAEITFAQFADAVKFIISGGGKCWLVTRFKEGRFATEFPYEEYGIYEYLYDDLETDPTARFCEKKGTHYEFEY